MVKHEHCEPAAQTSRDDKVPAAPWTAAKQGDLEQQGETVPFAPPRVGLVAVACTRDDDVSGSSHARGWAENRRPMDATAHSPGAASWWCCPAIDSARAGDRDGNYGYWPHRRRAGSHRLLCVAHGHEAPGQRDTAASHLAGEESLDQRSGPLSRAS